MFGLELIKFDKIAIISASHVVKEASINNAHVDLILG